MIEDSEYNWYFMSASTRLSSQTRHIMIYVVWIWRKVMICKQIYRHSTPASSIFLWRTDLAQHPLSSAGIGAGTGVEGAIVWLGNRNATTLKVMQSMGTLMDMGDPCHWGGLAGIQSSVGLRPVISTQLMLNHVYWRSG